ncbi:MAG: energy transducer TonB [Aquabacterium sp.]|nr:energy transducer TonB [Aquabacterium sp.]
MISICLSPRVTVPTVVTVLVVLAHGLALAGLLIRAEAREPAVALASDSPVVFVTQIPSRSPEVEPQHMPPTRPLPHMADARAPVAGVVAPAAVVAEVADAAQPLTPVSAPTHVTSEPAQVPAPSLIPESAVQYLQAPVLVYPRQSRRMGEFGRVTVRVLIDEAGLPGTVQVSRTSGFARLDEAALVAVRQARFRPYSQNGQPTAAWALIPLNFDLES